MCATMFARDKKKKDTLIWFTANRSHVAMCPFCQPGAERAILTHMHTVHAHPRANVDRYCQRAC